MSDIISLEVRIITNDGEVLVKAFNADDRQDWGWMLLPFINAVNGAGFIVDPYMIFKHCPYTKKDIDAVEMACNSPAGRHFGE